MYVEQPFNVLSRLDELLKAIKTVDVSKGGGSYITEPLSHIKFEGWPFGTNSIVRLIALLPSQQIVAHSDPPIKGKRYHIPLVTNSGCWSYSTGLWQQLETGHVYLMDPAEEHGAVNWGSSTRINLMVDSND